MFLSAVVVLVVGLVLYFLLADIVDSVVYRAASGKDPFEGFTSAADEAALSVIRRRAFVINVVRPAVLTVIIFGGGVTSVGLLRLPPLGALLAGVWFFFLTQHACLTGRTGASLNQAGWAMVVTIAAIVVIYVAAIAAR